MQSKLFPCAKTLWTTSIRHRSDTFVSNRCLIDVDPRVFALWVDNTIYQILTGSPCLPSPLTLTHTLRLPPPPPPPPLFLSLSLSLPLPPSLPLPLPLSQSVSMSRLPVFLSVSLCVSLSVRPSVRLYASAPVCLSVSVFMCVSTLLAKSNGRFFFRIIFPTSVTHRSTIFCSNKLDIRYFSFYK